MDIFYVNKKPAEENAERQPLPSRTTKAKRKRSWLSVLAEQVVNAVIVGGIAGLAALVADVSQSWKAALIAFGMAFLAEMRKYRNL